MLCSTRSIFSITSFIIIQPPPYSPLPHPSPLPQNPSFVHTPYPLLHPSSSILPPPYPLLCYPSPSPAPLSSTPMASTNAQLEPSSQPSTNLWGKQICMSGLDTSHSQFSNTTEDKFWDQWTKVQSIPMYIPFTPFYIRTDQLLMDSMHDQPEPSPRPYPSLWANKIGMSCFDKAHRQFATKPKDKYQDK